MKKMKERLMGGKNVELQCIVCSILLAPPGKASVNDTYLLLIFSHSGVTKTLRPHGLQHARLLCPSPFPKACSNLCPLRQWCHPAISSSVVPFSSCLQSFPVSGSFPMSRFFGIRWPKYWSFSFSISPSNEYSGLISFRIDWSDLLAVQVTLRSLLQCHSSNESVFPCSAFFMIQLSHPCMTTGKTIVIQTFVSKVMSLLIIIIFNIKLFILIGG